MLALSRVVRCAALVSSVLLSSRLVSQAPRPRLHDALSATARVQLPATREPLTGLGKDAGRVDPANRLEGVTLVFTRSPEQEADLQQLLTAQLDPASPSYHAWLTPTQFGARFGMAASDLEATTTWLRSFGLSIGTVSPSHDRLTFSGTVAQINAALGTELHHYQLNGQTHFAPADALSLPAPLAAVTSAVENLNDLRPEPMVALLPTPQPAYTTNTGAQHLLTPSDLATYYNATPLLTSSSAAATQGIAVVGQSAFESSAVSSFQSALGFTNLPYNVLLPNTGVFAKSPGNETEAELDLEYSSGLAPGAQIFYITPGDDPNHNVFDSVVYAIQQNIAPIITISYGQCETLVSSASLDSFNGILMQAAAQGQTVVTSAGDSGSTDCARYTSTSLSTTQLQATSVGFPASSPWVTAIGGTQMAAGTFTAGDTTYWSPSNSGVFPSSGSLRAYTPETAWNEGSVSAGILAGGGGSSAHFPRPAWQAGAAGLPGGTFRLIPDLSLQASINNPGFLICSGDPRSTGTTYNTTCQVGLSNTAGGYSVAGGTSFGAPAFAGMVALLNQATGTLNGGLLNPALYAMAAQPSSYNSAFHDIQTGTTGCTAGAANCSAAGQSAYPAGAGFDQATGLGTPNLAAIRDLLLATTPQQTTHPTSITFPVGGPVNNGFIFLVIHVNDISTGTTPIGPTGSVAITVDGQPQPAEAIQPFPTGTFSSTNFNGAIPSTAGAHLIQVSYAGDATHAAARATFSTLTGDTTPSGNFAFTVPNLNISTGATSTSTQVTVTPAGGYHGRVYWSLNYTTASNGLSACYIISPLLVTASGASSATFTINTGAVCSSTTSSKAPGTTRASRSGQPEAPWHHPGLPVVMAGLMLYLFPRRRGRQVPHILCLALVTFPLITLSLTGCGGSQASTAPPNQPVNPAPTVVGFSLTARDSVNTSIMASSNFTLTVN